MSRTFFDLPFANKFAPLQRGVPGLPLQGRSQLVGEAVCQEEYLANKFVPRVSLAQSLARQQSIYR